MKKEMKGLIHPLDLAPKAHVAKGTDIKFFDHRKTFIKYSIV